MTRAALYVRQSLDVQEGIDRQVVRCTRLAEARGWTVVMTYTDNDVSASKPRGVKTAWGRMLAESASFDVLIAVDLDRLIRTQRDLITLIDAGIKITTVDGDLDLASAEGELRASVMASVARFEVRRKSERQKRGADHRASQGMPERGRRPFGYEIDQITLRRDEGEALAWAHRELIVGASLHSIARRFNADGIRTTRGGLWATAQLRAVLKRERNAGIFVRNGVVQPVSKIEPAVTLEQHQTVLAILNERTNPVGRKPRTENWLSGIALCECGSPLLQKTVFSGDTRTRTYSCSAKLRGTAAPGKHVHIAAHLAEQAVALHFFDYMVDNEQATEPESDSITALYAEQTELQAQRVAAQEIGMLPGADMTHLAGTLTRLSERLEVVKRQLAAERARDAQSGAREAVEALWGDTGKTLTDAYEDFLQFFEDLDPERKRAIIRSAFRVVVTAGGYGISRVTSVPIS